MIPRNALPQIPKKQYRAFVDFLKDHGVQVKALLIDVERLHPVQANVNREKVDSLKKDPDALKQPLFISNEGLILDGHHRWIAKKELDPTGKIPVIAAGCGIRELVELGLQFEGSEIRSVYEVTTYGQKLFDGSPCDDSDVRELIVRKTLRPTG